MIVKRLVWSVKVNNHNIIFLMKKHQKIIEEAVIRKRFSKYVLLKILQNSEETLSPVYCAPICNNYPNL